MLEQHLKNLGLSKKESLTYLTSLKLGKFTVHEISRKSGIPRTTTYNLIKSLQEKGLVSEQNSNNKRYYTAQSPDRLLSNLHMQQKELQEKEKNLQNIMPDLKGLINLSRTKPKIEFFEGKEGIRSMQEDIINTRNFGTIEELLPIDQAYRLFPPHRRDHRHKMRKSLSGTLQRVIYTSEKGKVLSSNTRMVQRLFLSPDSFPISCEINLYGHKVSMVIFEQKPKGIIVDSREAADSLRAMFYSIWRDNGST